MNKKPVGVWVRSTIDTFAGHKNYIYLCIKAMNTLVRYCKNKLPECVLIVILFFSILSFAGYTSHSQSKNQQTTQTELVHSGNYITRKRAISYKKAFEGKASNDVLINPCTKWTNALLLSYNQHIKVKLNNSSRQSNSYKTATYFLPLKTIPQSSDEDIFTMLIG